MDENDLISTNKFIPEPELTGEVPSQFNEEFKNYYRAEMQRKEMAKVQESIENIRLDENTDENNILITNTYSGPSEKDDFVSGIKRKEKEIKTYVSVDSRDRDKKLYPNANSFKIFLGKTFYNIRRIGLVSIEFPNTDAVINNTNNKLYWVNQQDIDIDNRDAKTGDYPVYSSTLRNGSYIVTTLKSEIESKMSSVKRGGTDGYHYFINSFNTETNLVSFTSLILTSLQANSFSTSKDSNLLSINSTGSFRNFKDQETIYIQGAKTVGGISSSYINTSHTLIKISDDSAQIELTVTASEIVDQGGGNTAFIGKLAPFKLLFGNYSDVLAPKIGYPNENSSQRINNYIKNMNQLYMLELTIELPTKFARNTACIGEYAVITNVTGLDENKIVDVINNSIFIEVSSDTYESFGDRYNLVGATIKLKNDISIISNIISAVKYRVQYIYVETYVEHNLTFDDIGINIIMFNTATSPSFDGENEVIKVYGKNKFVIAGVLAPNGQFSGNGDITAGGSFHHHNVLNTKTFNLTSASRDILTNKLVLSVNMNETENEHVYYLNTGRSIKVFNLVTNPVTDKLVYKILTRTPTANVEVIDGMTYRTYIVTLDTSVSSINSDSINTAYISSSLVKLSFPYHGFNNIQNIQNVPSSSGTVEITTLLPHNLASVNNNGNGIYINNTTCVSNTGVIDKFYSNNDTLTENNFTIVDDDTFRISGVLSSNGILNTAGNMGIIGQHHDFYLYNTSDIAGISNEDINNKKFTVLRIIDQNTFLFDINGYPTQTTSSINDSIDISSLIHGFSATQINVKDDVVTRSINLQGENYSFLCCPQLNTMMNTGKVKDVFARISLNQSPGNMVFSFLSSAKEYDTSPLNTLSELEFNMLNYDNTFYNFNDLDYSFVLEITEVIDTTENFNISSRRGI